MLVALGQMFVVTLGPGNVDLSIPACMTLAGTVAMKVMDEADGLILVGLAIAALIGIGVGAVNYALIRFLRIPPIIATLSSSFIFLSAAIWYNRGLRIKPPPALAEFSTGMVGGIPSLAIVVARRLGRCCTSCWTRTIYGRQVIAIGQNPRAAKLAGVAVERIRAVTYILCGLLAGALRLPCRGVLRRRGAEHGGGVPAVLHRRGGDRRHLGRMAASPTFPASGARRCFCSCW